ncbi:MAG: hypothetical protein AB8W37_04145 [Arsenophonus endosymbiont of Dermacentor nuttalli]
MRAEPKNGIANLGMAIIMRQQKQSALALKYFKVAIRSSAINNTSMCYYYLTSYVLKIYLRRLSNLEKRKNLTGLIVNIFQNNVRNIIGMKVFLLT